MDCVYMCITESFYGTAEINHNIVNQLYVNKTLKNEKN